MLLCLLLLSTFFHSIFHCSLVLFLLYNILFTYSSSSNGCENSPLPPLKQEMEIEQYRMKQALLLGIRGRDNIQRVTYRQFYFSFSPLETIGN